MIKRRNRRGEMTQAQIAALVIAGVLVVIIVLFFSGAFGEITDYFTRTDFNPTYYTEICSSLKSVDVNGYCLNKIELAKNNYANCAYLVQHYNLKFEGSDTNPCVDDEGRWVLGPVQICGMIKSEQGDKYAPDKIKVNGDTCATWESSYSNNPPS